MVPSLRGASVQGFIAIPKSASKARIESNLRIYDFELAAKEIAELDELDECESSFVHIAPRDVTLRPPHVDLITDWDPTDTP